MNALKWAVHVTPTRWWGTHQRSFEDWRRCRRMMRLRFGKPHIQLVDKYDGHNDPRAHLTKWTKVYGEEPQPGWVHLLCHTLDVIPINWYTKTDLCHGTSEWDILREGLLLTFMFEDHWLDIVDDALQAVKETIFKIHQEPMEVLQLELATQLRCVLECYNVNVEEDDEDPRNINIPETEGCREVRGPSIEDPDITALLKTK